MILNSLEDLEKKGIYKITNLKNKKIYVGSTSESFKDRYTHHNWCLKNKKHKNKHLQSSYNKYGDNNFEFEIIEVIEDVNQILYKEQYYLDVLCISNKYSFNINKKATGGLQFTKDIYIKRGISIKNTLSIAAEYYQKFKNNHITLNEVPTKYKKIVEYYISRLGKKSIITKRNGYNFDHLKVSKSKTEKSILAREIVKVKLRETKTPKIEVYDTFGNYINTFRSAIDIEEYSIVYDNYFPILCKNLKTTGNRVSYLKAQNITACCNNRSLHYKGLQFKYENDNRKISFLEIKDIYSKFNVNTIYKKTNNIINRYSRLLEKSNMKHSLNSVKPLKQGNTEPILTLTSDEGVTTRY